MAQENTGPGTRVGLKNKKPLLATGYMNIKKTTTRFGKHLLQGAASKSIGDSMGQNMELFLLTENDI